MKTKQKKGETLNLTKWKLSSQFFTLKFESQRLNFSSLWPFQPAAERDSSKLLVSTVSHQSRLHYSATNLKPRLTSYLDEQYSHVRDANRESQNRWNLAGSLDFEPNYLQSKVNIF